MTEKMKRVELTPNQLINAYNQDQQKADVLQKRQQNLQQLLNEMGLASEAIKELQKAKEEKPIMVSLGAGFYAEAKIANIKTLKSSLAGNVLVESSAKEAIEKLDNEIKKAQKEISGVLEERQKTVRNMQGIATVLDQGRKAVRQARENSEKGEMSSVS